MSVLTLLTDFGTKDGFVGAMKGVIWKIAPQVKIADISHQVEPQNIMHGALMLARVFPFFGEGTVHVAVVDPGVGTERKALVAQIGNQFCVAPDNGLLTPLIHRAEEENLPLKLFDLTNRNHWLSSLSNTFHGRDIFAPVGAYIAVGVPIKEMGKPLNNPVLLDMPNPIKTAQGWQTEIMLIDHFGNLRTNLPVEKIEGDAKVHILGTALDGVAKSYGQEKAGDLLALKDSDGYLEIAVVNGSAAERLGAKVGDLVEVIAA